MLQTWRSRAYAAAAAVLIGLGFFYLFSAPAIPVDLAIVERAPLEVTIDEEGVARVQEIFVVSAPVAGLVQRAELEVGDPVREGETIVARIQPRAPEFLDERTRRAAAAQVGAAEAALQFARAGVERAEAELEFAREDLTRAERLLERRTVSERARDEAELRVKTAIAALHTAEADVNVKQQDLDTARAELIEPDGLGDGGQLACCVGVTAPSDGRVLNVIVESARVVAAGTPLIEIGDTADIEIEVDLLSSDAVRLEVGDPAYIERWGGGHALTARVDSIDPAGFEDVSALGIEEQRVTVTLALDESAERHARLGHEFRVFARIIEWRDAAALRVPISALFRDRDGWAVFLENGGVAELRRVDIGRRNQSHAQILSGLAEGDAVVTHPSDRILDGSSVISRDVAGAAL